MLLEMAKENRKIQFLTELIQKSCRVCLKSESTSENYNLFNNSEEIDIGIAEALTECTSVQILKDDGLPSLICDSCFAKLKIAYWFKNQCLQSDETLRKYLLQIEALKADIAISTSLRNKKNAKKNITKKNASEMPPKTKDATENSVNAVNEEKSIGEIKTESSGTNEHTSFETQKEGNSKALDCKVEIKSEHSNNVDDDTSDKTDSRSQNLSESEESNNCEYENESDNTEKVYLGHLSESNYEQTTCYYQQVNKLDEYFKSVTETSKDNNKRVFECDVCNKTFTAKATLKMHKLIHLGVRPHKCDICNKPFRRPKDLKRHKLIHSELRPHMCDICGKSFIQLVRLKTHQLQHSDERPFVCDVCNKSFVSEKALCIHKDTHTAGKPFMCDTCGASFTKIGSMMIHKRIHSNDRRFKCDMCPKSFFRATDVRRHKLTHTGERPHRCDVCNEGFVQRNCLTKHKLKYCGKERKRGRPKIRKDTVEDDKERRRYRPRKKKEEDEEGKERKQYRPRKKKDDGENGEKRKRGRPRKKKDADDVKEYIVL